MPDIISMGECMIELFADRPLAEAETFHKSFGGDSLNLLVAACRLGSTTGYITRVAKDPFGPYLLEAWRKEGVDISHVKQVEGFNAFHFISLLPGGERDFIYYRKGSAASTLELSDLDPQYIGSAKIFHCSGITMAISATARAATLKAAEMAREKGVTVSFDPNYRPRLWSVGEAKKAVEELLPYVNILLPGADDGKALWGASAPAQAVGMLRSRGVEVVAVKAGKDGVYLGAGKEEFHVPVYDVGQAMDTTGAGDAFNGAFLHGLVHGMEPKEAAMLGAITAGLKVLGRGAVKSLPTANRVFRIFNSLMKR